jgi:hypothetical protein
VNQLGRRAGAADAFYDYTGIRYEPVRDPSGKWRSSFILEAALDAAGDSALKEIVRAVGETVGAGATVWGAKRMGNRYSWELYFYDYTRENPRFRVSGVLEAIGRTAAQESISPDESRPRRHFMFSVDLTTAPDDDAAAPSHYYYYDVGDRMTGLSYRRDVSGWVLENHYAFYDPTAEAALLREKVLDSPRLGPDVPVQQVLLADLLDCRRVCVANKPSCDGVYFSGVTVAQFIRFLETFDHDRRLSAAIRTNESALDHMLYDVALDYRTTPRGDLELLKTAFYGTA